MVFNKNMYFEFQDTYSIIKITLGFNKLCIHIFLSKPCFTFSLSWHSLVGCNFYQAKIMANQYVSLPKSGHAKVLQEI